MSSWSTNCDGQGRVMLVKDHIVCRTGETLTPEQTCLIVSFDKCYMS